MQKSGIATAFRRSAKASLISISVFNVRRPRWQNQQNERCRHIAGTPERASTSNVGRWTIIRLWRGLRKEFRCLIGFVCGWRVAHPPQQTTPPCSPVHCFCGQSGKEHRPQDTAPQPLPAVKAQVQRQVFFQRSIQFLGPRSGGEFAQTHHLAVPLGKRGAKAEPLPWL